MNRLGRVLYLVSGLQIVAIPVALLSVILSMGPGLSGELTVRILQLTFGVSLLLQVCFTVFLFNLPMRRSTRRMIAQGLMVIGGTILASVLGLIVSGMSASDASTEAAVAIVAVCLLAELIQAIVTSRMLLSNALPTRPGGQVIDGVVNPWPQELEPNGGPATAAAQP